jgi:AraC-like DNA-binding protein
VSTCTLLRHEATGIERFAARWASHRTPSHAHPEYQLTWTTDGLGRFCHRGGLGTLGPGSAMLVHPSESHVLEALPGVSWQLQSLHLPARLVEHAGRPLVQPGPFVVDAGLARLLGDLWAALEGRAPRIERLVRDLSAWLGSRPGIDPSTPHLPAHVRRAVDFLAATLERPVPLDELAEVARVRPSRLRRDFVAATGLPPHTWHLQRRVVEAKLLLAAGHGVAATAAATGFVDQAHLSRHFQTLVGTTPARYARRG